MALQYPIVFSIFGEFKLTFAQYPPDFIVTLRVFYKNAEPDHFLVFTPVVPSFSHRPTDTAVRTQVS